MKNIKENMKEFESKLQEVKDHPMCVNLIEDERHYTVVFLKDNFAVDGIRIHKAMGKIKALQTLIDKMEYFWKSSFPGYRHEV